MEKTPEKKLKDYLYALMEEGKAHRLWEQKLENGNSTLVCWNFNDHMVIFQIWKDGGFALYDNSTAPGNSLEQTFKYLDLLLRKSQKDSWVPVEVLGKKALKDARLVPSHLIKKQNDDSN